MGSVELLDVMSMAAASDRIKLKHISIRQIDSVFSIDNLDHFETRRERQNRTFLIAAIITLTDCLWFRVV